MKVLFIYPNINGYHTDTYSFGLASIVSITRINGHNARVMIIKTREEYDKVISEINTFKPQIVGFSSVSSQFSFVEELASKIKTKFPRIITVCGGAHPTINPHCILRNKILDAIFLGESENSFIEFLGKIEKKECYKGVDNLAYVDQGKVVINKLKPLIANLDELPYPDRHIYPFEETLQLVGYAPFLFSRGCPYFCSYCSNHAIAKIYNMPSNKPRYRTPESSIAEIEEAIGRFSIKKILIVDDIFGLDKQWREEFCQKYKKCIKIRFQCLLRANVIDEDFVKLLKFSGCYRISIGVESGNEYVRNKIMNRQMSNGQIVKAFYLARKHGLETNAINIIGVPGETEEMLKDTIGLNKAIRPTTSGVNIFYPYKGTQLGDYCFDEGLVDEISYYNFSNERRGTVLKYPEKYKKRLCYYRENWDFLIYPFDIKRRIIYPLRKMLMKMFIWKYMRLFKHYLYALSINKRGI